MNIISLFDGLSCAQLALQRAGIPIQKYYSSEIDKDAISVTQNHFPDTIQLGDAREIDYTTLSADIMFGGFPCQDLSINKRNRQGLNGTRSSLFYIFLKALHTIKPKYFFVENVASMPSDVKNIITSELGVLPVEINSSIVSAQQRKRLYWTNLKIPKFQPCNTVVKDILDEEYNKYIIDAEFVPSEKRGTPLTTIRIGSVRNQHGKLTNSQYARVYSSQLPTPKGVGLSAE